MAKAVAPKTEKTESKLDVEHVFEQAKLLNPQELVELAEKLNAEMEAKRSESLLLAKQKIKHDFQEAQSMGLDIGSLWTEIGAEFGISSRNAESRAPRDVFVSFKLGEPGVYFAGKGLPAWLNALGKADRKKNRKRPAELSAEEREHVLKEMTSDQRATYGSLVGSA